MNQAQAMYAQASQEYGVASKYRSNYEFWKIVLGALYEEIDIHADHLGEFKRQARQIRGRMRRNLRMCKKIKKRADRALEKYNRWLRKESNN